MRINELIETEERDAKKEPQKDRKVRIWKEGAHGETLYEWVFFLLLVHLDLSWFNSVGPDIVK